MGFGANFINFLGGAFTNIFMGGPKLGPPKDFGKYLGYLLRRGGVPFSFKPNPFLIPPIFLGRQYKKGQGGFFPREGNPHLLWGS